MGLGVALTSRRGLPLAGGGLKSTADSPQRPDGDGEIFDRQAFDELAGPAAGELSGATLQFKPFWRCGQPMGALVVWVLNENDQAQLDQ